MLSKFRDRREGEQCGVAVQSDVDYLEKWIDKCIKANTKSCIMTGTALSSSSGCILTVLEEVLQEKGWEHMMYEEMMRRLHLLSCEKIKGSCLQLPDWRI